MAFMINDECVSCGACEAACPNKSISVGEIRYEIDPDKCTECKGYFESQQCAKNCPVDACVPDPDREESEEELLAKKARNEVKV